jgi:beta-lactamase regulating signal transducer with metallopeptidase domain
MHGIETIWSLPLTQAVAWALAHFLWQGALVGLLLAVILALLGRKNASLRYAVSVGALALLLALPVATSMWRAWMGETGAVLREQPVGLSEPVPVQDALLPRFLAFWTLGVTLLSVYHLGGWLQARRLRKRSTRPIPEPWEQVVEQLRRRLGIWKAVEILETSALAVPVVIGWLRPVILVPASALTGLTPQQLEAILAHELAHVRRHDYFVNLFQTVVETLLFYHPVVWWVSRVIRREREHCCDDLAVAVYGDRMIYARALAELEGLRAAPSPHLALASTDRPLLARVRRIVGVPSEPSRPSWLIGVLTLTLLPAVFSGAANAVEPTVLSRDTLSRFQALGLELPAEELRVLAKQGVTPEYIRIWKQAGYSPPLSRNPEELRQYANILREFRQSGVTPEYRQELLDCDFRKLNDLVVLGKQKVPSYYIRELAYAGYCGIHLSPDDVVKLWTYKVDPDFVKKTRKREGRHRTADELVNLWRGTGYQPIP